MHPLEPYLTRLRELRGIKDVKVLAGSARGQDPGFDAVVSLRSEAGATRLLAVEYKSHLGHQVADHLIASAGRHPEHPVLVLAPHIGAPLGARLAAAGINYLDMRGNCHLAVGSLFVHVEGRAGAPPHSGEKGLRSAAYQILFVYLADPALLDAPLRTVGGLAGVSRQPAFDMRHRLFEDEYLVETSKGIRWLDRRRDDALGLWLHGYETTVRPSLVSATYRTAKADPDEVEKQLLSVFRATNVPDFRWGGSTAGFRLTKHFRGERTTVHLRAIPEDLRQRLGALSHPDGNLVVLNSFGEINWRGGEETVHPLLVYSEMLQERNERAREAAHELFETHVRASWSRTT